MISRDNDMSERKGKLSNISDVISGAVRVISIILSRPMTCHNTHRHWTCHDEQGHEGLIVKHIGQETVSHSMSIIPKILSLTVYLRKTQWCVRHWDLLRSEEFLSVDELRWHGRNCEQNHQREIGSWIWFVVSALWAGVSHRWCSFREYKG